MGFIRQSVAKLTGADVAADAAERAAQEQAAAVRASAERSAKAAQEAAQQSARQQEQAASRNLAVAAAAETAKTAAPIQSAEVVLDLPEDGSNQSARKRREKFGIGTVSSGVNI